MRKDPTFSEANYGFRTLSELLRFLEGRKVIELGPGTARGDAEVTLPVQGRGDEEAFALLRSVVADLQSTNTAPLMSGLKNQLRKRQPGFSERQLGYSGFLQFCRAAATRGLVTLEWHDEAGDYLLLVAPDG